MSTLFRALILMLVFMRPALAQENREYHLLSAYIYNFTQFTTWSADSLSNGLAVCVVGADPFGALLDPMENKTAQGAKISVKRLSGASGNLSGCNVLFISNALSGGNIQSALSSVKSVPVLTMSNIAGFAEAGGMVEFDKEGTKIALKINRKATQAAGLSISSKLLSLARIVE